MLSARSSGVAGPRRGFLAGLLLVLLVTMALPSQFVSAQEAGGVLPASDNPVAVIDGAPVTDPAPIVPVTDAAPVQQVAAAPEGAVTDGAVADPTTLENTTAYSLNPSLAPPPITSTAPAVPAVPWAPPTTVYIPETGQSVDGVFLDTWRAWGGALSWGNPITQEFTQDGHIVQYYGYGRFEYWPEDPNGEVVKFGKIGSETRPYVLRRGPAASLQVSDTSIIVRAWLPLSPNDAPPDSADWRYVPAARHGVAGEFKALWENTGEAAYLGNPMTEQYTLSDGITYQVFERGKVAMAPGGAPYLVPLGDYEVTQGRLDRTQLLQGELPTYSEELFTPPPAPAPVVTTGEIPVDPNAERWIEVSISQQYLWARQGDVVLWEGYVSTGRPGFDTPTGTFNINRKLPVEDMAGVIGGESYNVPEVPDVMYFTDVGHAIHGTYWHSNFGTQMSHGCINLPMDVAEWMYEWTSVGTRLVIQP